ncbi:MAG: 4Fe-4S binding protein [Magnetococcales bacterium]|nr:4Fe-4S binding protein [Magnetococcales bacterium]
MNFFPGLRAIRRIYALFFLGLFLFLYFVADFRNLKGYEVSLFLELDPLTALAGLLTSATLYQGLAWSLVILLPTLFLGRFFCSWICPLGIVNQGVGWLWDRRRPAERQEGNRYRLIYRWKYYILAGLLVLAAAGTLQTGWLDPIALITRSLAIGVGPAAQQAGGRIYLNAPYFHGGVMISLIFLAIVLANRWMSRFWCRVLCPLGALLGLFSRWSVWRIRRDVDHCTDCRKCLLDCQGGCDPHDELRVSECHVCMNCIESCPEGALHYGLAQPRSSVHKPLDVSRRRLVEGTAASLLFFPMLRSSRSDASSPDPQVIRPPGSLSEKEFLARCLKCGACMRVCPTNVLQPALLESGLEGIWTPILVYRLGYCEHHCVLCGQVCPTAAIRPVGVAEKVGEAAFLQPIKLGTAFFDQGRCLPWSMQTPCIVCEEVCPTTPKAIWYRTVEEKDRRGKPVRLKQPYVEPALCIGCGICENKCPVTDHAAIRVTSVGESRSRVNQMILNPVSAAKKEESPPR